MDESLRELYQEVILDHSRHPRNFGRLDETERTCHVHGDNPACGDEVELYLRLSPERAIEAIRFEGQGCAISQASASMMTQKVLGISTAEARQMIEAFHQLVAGDKEEEPTESLGELRILAGVKHFPQRVKCAMLAWRALQQALQTADK